MKTKKLVLGFTFVLATAFIAPVVAYMSNEPGTIIDIKDFVRNTFETALATDVPLNVNTIVVDSVDIEALS